MDRSRWSAARSGSETLTLLGCHPGHSDAYHVPMGKPNDLQLPRAVRWSLWLLAGTAVGLLVGFAFGLAKPRVPGPAAHVFEQGGTT